LRALGVFATAPIPGRVKPRLAADVGPSVASEVYWRVVGCGLRLRLLKPLRDVDTARDARGLGFLKP